MYDLGCFRQYIYFKNRLTTNVSKLLKNNITYYINSKNGGIILLIVRSMYLCQCTMNL